ncbi:unnamed protein product [Clonostachys chloroleuca]|uniref:Tubulin-specific chaperone D C-terminal domain-containing protein n=1 Tax=Clonostachys chloroleuca TaxID=1926264 RepID=A0AA35M5B9_9HYPO|nr:unnamed protein product [Clonostachys chloroleuca]
MDAPEQDYDTKLQKASNELLAEFDKFLSNFFRKSDGKGGSRVRSRVRAREVHWATSNCLDPFQELPQLLDPYLSKWIPLLSKTYLERLQSRRPEKKNADLLNLLVPVEFAICKILYTFCKIRGEKVIVHFLNVEAKYLELLLGDIEEAEQSATGESPANTWSWEQRYIVLLWLSHLLLAPFDLSTISSVELDDAAASDVPGLRLPPNLPGIALRAIPLSIKYLASPGKERDGAKALLVRITMRRDMQQLGILDSLVQWSLSSLRPKDDGSHSTPYFYLGILSYLAGILQSSSDTSDMDKYLSSIFDAVHKLAHQEDATSKTIISLALARKMILKVIRTVIVSFLRHSRQDMASTELTETAIGYLLENLSDNDTPVRLAASKSLSIITLKLDPDMASQVVEAVLESLNQNVLWKKNLGSKPVRDLSAVSHLEWHGLMLTLSHLLYRRSPPAEQLADIIHALLLGLSFEQRGTSGASVGSNVRDAACFGIWALARRYTTKELQDISTQSVFAARTHPASSSILQVLGTELAMTASLDSAGNIRRGASAALQELIGRHPDTVEKGIWVVQAVDYHAVARRSRAMEEVALKAAKLSPQYGEAIIDGILTWRGIGDTDAGSRRAAGSAFGALTAELSFEASEDPFVRFNGAIELLSDRLKALEKRQVEERHGLLVCFAALLNQFSRWFKAADGAQIITSLIADIINRVTGIVSEYKTQTYRRPELIAEGVSRLVSSLAAVIQAALLGDQHVSDIQTMDELLAQKSTAEFLDLVSTVDSVAQKPAAVKELLTTLRDVVPMWLSRTESDVVDSASTAALVLLMFSEPVERADILAEWAATIRNRGSSGKITTADGYFYTLALAQPLVTTFRQPGDDGKTDIVCETILARWNADEAQTGLAKVETRVAILQSLTRSQILHNQPLVFLDILSDGLDDYTTTARGDIGSHVRVEALRAVGSLWRRIRDGPSRPIWAGPSIRALFYGTLRLAAEKFDRVRPEAQVALSLVLEKQYGHEFRWLGLSSEKYFRALLQLVDLDNLPDEIGDIAKDETGTWMASLMAGLVTSADTGNEDLVIASRAALTTFCNASQRNLDLVYGALFDNLKLRQGEDRVIVPTLEITAFLFHVGVLQRSETISLRSLCLQTQKAGYKTGNVRKLEACIKVYGAVATLGSRRDEAETAPDAASTTAAGIQEARKRLGALLFHPWPKVRTMVVDELWGLVGEREEDGARLTGFDWGEADKNKIRTVVQDLRLG